MGIEGETEEEEAVVRFLEALKGTLIGTEDEESILYMRLRDGTLRMRGWGDDVSFGMLNPHLMEHHRQIEVDFVANVDHLYINCRPFYDLSEDVQKTETKRVQVAEGSDEETVLERLKEYVESKEGASVSRCGNVMRYELYPERITSEQLYMLQNMRGVVNVWLRQKGIAVEIAINNNTGNGLYMRALREPEKFSKRKQQRFRERAGKRVKRRTDIGGH